MSKRQSKSQRSQKSPEPGLYPATCAACGKPFYTPDARYAGIDGRLCTECYRSRKLKLRPPGDDGVRLREGIEIHRAHDILNAVICGDVTLPGLALDAPQPLTTYRDAMRYSLDVLCWVLRHDHVNGFTENLAALQDIMDAIGTQVVTLPHPMSRAEMADAVKRILKEADGATGQEGPVAADAPA
jgi:hypothetical protein